MSTYDDRQTEKTARHNPRGQTMISPNQPPRCCPGVSRRSFLADTGMGFTRLALGAMLFRDGVARAAPLTPRGRGLGGEGPPDGKPHFVPKAKAVIWIFLCGGVSHVESFDPKPELNKYAGKTIDDTPYKEVL